MRYGGRWPTLRGFVLLVVLAGAGCVGSGLPREDDAGEGDDRGSYWPDQPQPADGHPALDGAPGDDGGPSGDGLEPDDAVASDGRLPDTRGRDGSSRDRAAGDARPRADARRDGSPTGCGFTYESEFPPPPAPPMPPPLPPLSLPLPSSMAPFLDTSPAYPSTVAPFPGGPPPPASLFEVDQIAHIEPAPPATYRLLAPGGWRHPLPEVVLPAYGDDLPLFSRAAAWGAGASRCFETPAGPRWLTEEQAYDLYRKIAELTTGVTVDDDADVRTVVGLRGAYPGTFAWNGNRPDYFNDTLALLWKDTAGTGHLREFPAHSDTGAYDFGVNASSSLRPNRRYRYINGWHGAYNALRIDEDAYRVRDDTNHNGHWDSDRNGWLPPRTADDRDRNGSGHNIHTAERNAPLGQALVADGSAGCQVIPGQANWKEFILSAWTGLQDPVSYFLVDARDIAPDVWRPCTPDGTHDCPYRIASLPFSDARTTAGVGTRVFDVYNCSPADESGPEVVYLLTIDRSGTLSISIECTAPIDVDIYLLDGDDPLACLARHDRSLTYAITPGRYLIVADTYVSGGVEHVGAYTLRVSIK